jgi:hypothetical protein
MRFSFVVGCRRVGRLAGVRVHAADVLTRHGCLVVAAYDPSRIATLLA